MTSLVVTIYLLTITALSLYGLLGLLTLGLYWRHRHDVFPSPPPPPELPPVTVQLPIYNERFVVARLIEAAVSLNYPRERLQIQVVDDSTDDTIGKVAELVAYYRREGIDISVVRRRHRRGYKAGALANALTRAKGEFIAVFDADFKPSPDFLQRTMPHFATDSNLGMIQARWGHLNDHDSPLTAAQAIALDKHFAMEQTVRHRANLFPKFNGAGGIWRRVCLENAGGWEEDTVCEDLCLSTRAILRGWKFLFLNDLVAPAELPTTISAYKNQQARWSKGSSQCLIKFGRPILTNKNHSLTARLYALISMSAYTTQLLFLLMLVLQLPLVLINYRFSLWMLVFSIASMGQPLLFIMSQRVLYPDWRRRLRHFPTLLLVAIGTAPSTSRAILQALFGRHHPFIRTPKVGGQSVSEPYRLRFDWIVIVEIVLCLYAVAGIFMALVQGSHGPLLFLILCGLGFGYVAFLTLDEQKQHD